MKNEWEVYDSVAYKIMCIMDISTDINPNYKTDFESSEEMFNNLTINLQRFEEQDNGSGDWYSSLVEFLRKEL